MTETPGKYNKRPARFGGITRFFSRHITKDIYDGTEVIIEQSNKKGEGTMAEKKEKEKKEWSKIRGWKKAKFVLTDEEIQTLNDAIDKGGDGYEIQKIFNPPIYITELKNYVLNRINERIAKGEKVEAVIFSEPSSVYTPSEFVKWTDGYGITIRSTRITELNIPDGTEFTVEAEVDKKGVYTITLTSK